MTSEKVYDRQHYEIAQGCDAVLRTSLRFEIWMLNFALGLSKNVSFWNSLGPSRLLIIRFMIKCVAVLVKLH